MDRLEWAALAPDFHPRSTGVDTTPLGRRRRCAQGHGDRLITIVYRYWGQAGGRPLPAGITWRPAVACRRPGERAFAGRPLGIDHRIARAPDDRLTPRATLGRGAASRAKPAAGQLFRVSAVSRRTAPPDSSAGQLRRTAPPDSSAGQLRRTAPRGLRAGLTGRAASQLPPGPVADIGRTRAGRRRDCWPGGFTRACAHLRSVGRPRKFFSGDFCCAECEAGVSGCLWRPSESLAVQVSPQVNEG